MAGDLTCPDVLALFSFSDGKERITEKSEKSKRTGFVVK